MRKLCCFLILLGVLTPGTASAVISVDLSIEPSTQSAGIGEVVAYDVYLRNNGDVVGSIDLDFGALPAGLSFQAGPGVPDGFDENDPPMPTDLPLELDGSLLDGHTPGIADLSYAGPFTGGGIPASTDRKLGTFWVSADSVGVYPLSLNNNATAVYTDLGVSFGINYSDAELVVSVIPEPSGLALMGLVLMGVRRRR